MYSLELLSLRPMQGSRVVHLTVLAPGRLTEHGLETNALKFESTKGISKCLLICIHIGVGPANIPLLVPSQTL